MTSSPPALLLDRILYRDGLILIIDKPAGLPVHAGPRGGATVEDYLEALRFGLPKNPHLAHRLDRDTSGCLILGRHKNALRRLGRLFEAGKVQKTYHAIVHGKPDPIEGRIDKPLLKLSTAKRGWWMSVDEKGKRAVTEYKTLRTIGGHSLVELKPETGRTHQLRVHLDAIGCAIVGDPVYGLHPEDTTSLLLHATNIILPLSEFKPTIVANAPIPGHWPDDWMEAANTLLSPTV